VNIAVPWLDRPQRGEFPDEVNNAARVLKHEDPTLLTGCQLISIKG
jgi:hypothetical protein